MSSFPVTLVSCYFPLKNAKYNESTYLKWMKTFLQNVKAPLIVYTTAEFRDVIENLRGSLPLLVRETTLEKFHVYENLSEFQHSHEIDPEKKIHNTSLYMIWNEKTSFVKQEIDNNPYGSKYFFWVDIGCFRDERILHIITNWPLVERVEYETKRKDAVMILNIDSFTENELAWKSTSEEDLGPNFEKTVRLGGGIFGGSIDAFNKWHFLYYATLKKYFDAKRFAGKDQNIMATVCLKYPQTVNLIKIPPEASKEGDIWFFMHRFLGEMRYQST